MTRRFTGSHAHPCSTTKTAIPRYKPLRCAKRDAQMVATRARHASHRSRNAATDRALAALSPLLESPSSSAQCLGDPCAHVFPAGRPEIPTFVRPPNIASVKVVFCAGAVLLIRKHLNLLQS